MWPKPSKERTLLTIEADNSVHLIRHDELGGMLQFFFKLVCNVFSYWYHCHGIYQYLLKVKLKNL
jgi:hypothetical protein